jgi:hypothetical protein
MKLPFLIMVVSLSAAEASELKVGEFLLIPQKASFQTTAPQKDTTSGWSKLFNPNLKTNDAQFSDRIHTLRSGERVPESTLKSHIIVEHEKGSQVKLRYPNAIKMRYWIDNISSTEEIITQFPIKSSGSRVDPSIDKWFRWVQDQNRKSIDKNPATVKLPVTLYFNFGQDSIFSVTPIATKGINPVDQDRLQKDFQTWSTKLKDKFGTKGTYFEIYSELMAVMCELEYSSIQEISKDLKLYAMIPKRAVIPADAEAFQQTQVPQAWQEQHPSSASPFEGFGVRIGIVDSGVDTQLPGFGNCIGPTCPKIIAYKETGMPIGVDERGHGTPVAAIAAGMGTLPGVAKSANLLVAPVDFITDDGFWALDYTVSGTLWMADPNQDGDPSDKAHIINLSLGTNGPSLLDNAVRYALANGAVVVASAGNSGPGVGTIKYPAALPEVIAVGASCMNTESNQQSADCSNGPIAQFSSVGSETQMKPDVVSPGVRICIPISYSAAFSTNGIYDYQPGNSCSTDTLALRLSGTSFSAPMVSGVAALMLQANPQLNASQVKTILQQTAVPFADVSLQKQGAGEIRARDAVLQASGTPPLQIPTYAWDFEIPNDAEVFTGTKEWSFPFDGSQASVEPVYANGLEAQKESAGPNTLKIKVRFDRSKWAAFLYDQTFKNYLAIKDSSQNVIARIELTGKAKAALRIKVLDNNFVIQEIQDAYGPYFGVFNYGSFVAGDPQPEINVEITNLSSTIPHYFSTGTFPSYFVEGASSGLGGSSSFTLNPGVSVTKTFKLVNNPCSEVSQGGTKTFAHGFFVKFGTQLWPNSSPHHGYTGSLYCGRAIPFEVDPEFRYAAINYKVEGNGTPYSQVNVVDLKYYGSVSPQTGKLSGLITSDGGLIKTGPFRVFLLGESASRPISHRYFLEKNLQTNDKLLASVAEADFELSRNYNLPFTYSRHRLTEVFEATFRPFYSSDHLESIFSQFTSECSMDPTCQESKVFFHTLGNDVRLKILDRIGVEGNKLLIANFSTSEPLDHSQAIEVSADKIFSFKMNLAAIRTDRDLGILVNPVKNYRIQLGSQIQKWEVATVKPDESSGPDEMDQLNYSFEISETNTTTPRPIRVPSGQLYAPIRVDLQSGKRFFYTDISDASSNIYFNKEYPGLNLDFAPGVAPAFFSGKHIFNPVSKTIQTTHVLTPGLPLVQRQDFTFRERKSIPVSYSRSAPMNSFSDLKASPGWGEVNNWRLFPLDGVSHAYPYGWNQISIPPSSPIAESLYQGGEKFRATTSFTYEEGSESYSVQSMSEFAPRNPDPNPPALVDLKLSSEGGRVGSVNSSCDTKISAHWDPVHGNIWQVRTGLHYTSCGYTSAPPISTYDPSSGQYHSTIPASDALQNCSKAILELIAHDDSGNVTGQRIEIPVIHEPCGAEALNDEAIPSERKKSIFESGMEWLKEQFFEVE